jgi:hypothetical protein
MNSGVVSSCKIILIALIMLSPNILSIKSSPESFKIPLTIRVYPDASFNIGSKIEVQVPENIPLDLSFTSIVSSDGKQLTSQLQAQLLSREVAESMSRVFRRIEIGAVGREEQAEMDIYIDFNEDELEFIDLLFSISLDEAKAKLTLSETLIKAEGEVMVLTDNVDMFISMLSTTPQYLRPTIEQYLTDTGITINKFSVNGVAKGTNLCSALFEIELEGNITKASEKIMEEQCMFSPFLLVIPFMPVADEGGRTNITITTDSNAISISGSGELRFSKHIDEAIEFNKLQALSIVEQAAKCDIVRGSKYLPLIQKLKNTTISYRSFKIVLQTEARSEGRFLRGDLQLVRLKPPLEGTSEDFKFTNFIQDFSTFEEELKTQLNLFGRSLDKSWSMDVEIICVQEEGKKLTITIPSSAPVPQYQNNTYAKWIDISSISQLKDVSFHLATEKKGVDMLLLVVGIVIIAAVFAIVLIILTKRKKPPVETLPPPLSSASTQ